MKIKNTLYLVLAMVVAFAGGAFTMAQVRDWHDVEKVHNQVINAIGSMDRLQEANGYHMGGHGERAKEHLRAAEKELQFAVDYMRSH